MFQPDLLRLSGNPRQNGQMSNSIMKKALVVASRGAPNTVGRWRERDRHSVGCETLNLYKAGLGRYLIVQARSTIAASNSVFVGIYCLSEHGS